MKRPRPPLRVLSGGPSRDVQRDIATAIRILRKSDVRAIALVWVMPNGQVGTMAGGQKDGLYHQLASGVAMIQHRIVQGGNE